MSGNNLSATVPTSPAVWTDTGELRMEWRVFFGQLWQRTGGSQGGAIGTGTITGVTAGPGLTGGGGSGTVTVALDVPVTVAHGGTGATTAAQALTNLGGVAEAPNDGNAYLRASLGWSSGGTLTGTLTVNPGIIVTPQINTPGGADLILPEHLQSRGLTFWPPGGGITWSGAQTPFINVGHTLVGSTTSTGVVAPYLFTLNADTVAAQPVNSMSWLAINGNVGNPNVWTTSHAYGVGAQVANGGRLYNCTTAGTSAASGTGPSGTGTVIADGSAVWSYTAPNAVGDRAAIYGQITVASTPGDVLAGRAAGSANIAVGGHTQIAANLGGTNLTTAAAGSAWGANFLASLGPAATNTGEIVGMELDIACQAGSSTKNKIGLQIVQTSTDAVSATNGDDIALLLANQALQATAPGWTIGISFGSSQSAFPIKSTGTLIGANTRGGTINAGIGVDLSAVVFSTAAFRSTGFVVDGAGNTTVNNVGFHGTAPVAKPTVTGAKGGNTALASLLTALAAYGLVIDSTTA